MTFTVYGLRLRGTTDVRYIGQTNGSLEDRVTGHRRVSVRMPKPTVFATWFMSNDSEIEAFPISEHETRVESLAAERNAITLCLALGHQLFNQQHVPPALRIVPWGGRFRVFDTTPSKRELNARAGAA